MPKCRQCGEPIDWRVTPNGRKQPVNEGTDVVHWTTCTAPRKKVIKPVRCIEAHQDCGGCEHRMPHVNRRHEGKRACGKWFRCGPWGEEEVYLRVRCVRVDRLEADEDA